MALKYTLRMMAQNKKRTAFLTIGMVFLVTLLSSMFIATAQIQQIYLQQSLGSVLEDYLVIPNQVNTTNNLDLAQSLRQLNQTVPSFAGAFQSEYYQIRQGLLQTSDNRIDWATINTTGAWYKAKMIHLWGVSPEFWDYAACLNRLFPSITMDEGQMNATNGIAIDSQTANTMNLTIGSIVVVSGFNYDLYLSNVSQFYAEENLTQITGIFTINNAAEFDQIISGQNYDYPTNDMYIIGNFTTINAWANDFGLILGNRNANQLPSGTALPYIGGSGGYVFDAVLVDHAQLSQLDQTAFDSTITAIQTQIITVTLQSGAIVTVQNQLQGLQEEIANRISTTQNALLFFAIPVVIAGWYVVKISYNLSFKGRRREIGILKSKGVTAGQIKLHFHLEALIIGAVAGIIGVILGNLVTGWVYPLIYPSNLPPFNLPLLWNRILTFQTLTWSNWVVGIGGSMLLSLLAIRSPLKESMAEEVIESIAKYSETVEKEIPRKKSDWILFVIGIYPIVLSLISPPLIAAGLYDQIPFLFILINTNTFVLPIAPFFLIYASVKLFLGRFFDIFAKGINWISAQFSKPLGVFISKGILRHRAQSARIIFIVAMVFGFAIMTLIIDNSEIAYQKDENLMDSGNGISVDISSSRISNEGLSSCINFLRNQSQNFPLAAINWFEPLASVNFPQIGEILITPEGTNYDPLAKTSISAGVISAKNYSQWMNIPDRWFVGDSASNVLNRLATVPNATIIPIAMQQVLGLGENSSILMQFQTVNLTQKEIMLNVVGVFNALPLISNIEIFPTIIIDNATISDALVSEPVAIAVYPLLKSTTPNAINSTNFQQILSEYDPTATITAITMNDYTDGMIGTSQIISQFLLIEIVFLLVLVVFGIGIVLYIGVQEKSHDLGILRARGVDKWVVYKMQVAEGGILIGIGMLLSFLGILAAYTNLIQFNTTFTIEFSLVPQFLIPWSGLLWLLGVSSVVMITNILIAVKTEMHNSEISHIAALLRV